MGANEGLGGAMKVLFIAWYFPPSNTIAAVRLGKLAKFLVKAGHDVRVLSAKDLPYAPTLPVEIAEDRIYRTAWIDIDSFPSRLKTRVARVFKRRPAAKPSHSGTATAKTPPRSGAYFGGVASKLYQLIFNIPDKQVGWLPRAVSPALRLVKEWRPEVIFATAPPFTCLLMGYLLSRRTGIPLIVEYRDRWSDDPYYPAPWWRQQIDRWLEGIITRHAIAITTVSEPWAEAYRTRYRKPVAVVYNGYDPADLPQDVVKTGPGGWPARNILRISHTGGVYRGRRDPSPLFAAISRNDDLRRKVRVVFYGLATDHVASLARDYGVENIIEIHSRVDHAEALRQQRQSDILLLMQMDSPLEEGNVPGKFFEYLGARRPILVLGWERGVPATFVRQRQAGAATTDPDTVAELLRTWIAAKERDGRLPDLPDEVCAGFTHAEQTARLEVFLQQTLARNCREANPKDHADNGA
jgi:glycosyltransferase involved in cell wall biosynthesis